MHCSTRFVFTDTDKCRVGVSCFSGFTVRFSRFCVAYVHVQVNPDLESLDLSSNSVGAQGVAALAEALAENAHVTAFFLASKGVNAQGAVALSKALKVNDSITELHLWNNSLGVAGSASIAHALKVNRSLQVCAFLHIERAGICLPL